MAAAAPPQSQPAPAQGSPAQPAPAQTSPAAAPPAQPAPGQASPAAAAPQAAAAPSAQQPVAAATNPLVNKPGEPAFQMKLEPDTLLHFKSDKLNEEATNVDLKITNTTAKRQTFKVRCTLNEVFRVRPPLGFIEPNATQTITITFMSKEIPVPGKHFFAIYHMSTEDKPPTQARTVWTATSKPEGVKRVGCSFEKADGTQYPPTEKK